MTNSFARYYGDMSWVSQSRDLSYVAHVPFSYLRLEFLELFSRGGESCVLSEVAEVQTIQGPPCIFLLTDHYSKGGRGGVSQYFVVYKHFSTS